MATTKGDLVISDKTLNTTTPSNDSSTARNLSETPANSANPAKTTGYDLIGDIHGHADELIALLEKMGYINEDGCYRHPNRTAIFLGDFIDRGPQQKRVLDTVMAMVNSGAAMAVMGNHEFNAIAYHTEDPEMPGTWLRPHNPKNTNQHEAFLAEFGGEEHKAELEDVLAFFYSLPLWLELEGLRAVHASWHPDHMDVIRKHRGDDGAMLTPDLLVDACREGSDLYNAVEVLLKGVEHSLPGGVVYYDKENNARSNVRVWWHHNEFKTLGDILIGPHDLDAEILEIVVNDSFIPGYNESERPVFLGHYWRQGHPEKLSSNVACLDYSIGAGGKLVAYRWSGEKTLEDTNFYYVKENR